jgi:hypothetical protein
MNAIAKHLAVPAILAASVACSTTSRTGLPSGAVPDAAPLTGRWGGTYTCPQGITGLTLTITPGSRGQLSAQFDFFPIATNPNVPSGSYRMAGWVTTDGQIALVGVQWIDQPDDYLMVGLFGRLRDPDRTITGIVPECAAPFTLRQEPQAG